MQADWFLEFYKDVTSNLHCLLTLKESYLLYLLAKKIKNGDIVEIGSFEGASTIMLAKDLSPCVTLYAVDWHQGSNIPVFQGTNPNTKQKFLRNIEQFGVKEGVIPKFMKSEEFAKNYAGDIELLFIDGSHLYEDVRNDFLMFKDRTITNSFIAFHDANRFSFLKSTTGAFYTGPLRCVLRNIIFSQDFIYLLSCDSIILCKKVKNKRILDYIAGLLIATKLVFNSLIAEIYLQHSNFFPSPVKIAIKKFRKIRDRIYKSYFLKSSLLRIELKIVNRDRHLIRIDKNRIKIGTDTYFLLTLHEYMTIIDACHE